MLERQPGRVDLLPSIGRAVGQEALLQLLERAPQPAHPAIELTPGGAPCGAPPGALPRVEASAYPFRPRCDFAVTEEALGAESRTR